MYHCTGLTIHWDDFCPNYNHLGRIVHNQLIEAHICVKKLDHHLVKVMACGLLSANPLPESMLTSQLDYQKQTKFGSNHKIVLPSKCIWKYHIVDEMMTSYPNLNVFIWSAEVQRVHSYCNKSLPDVHRTALLTSWYHRRQKQWSPQCYYLILQLSLSNPLKPCVNRIWWIYRFTLVE